MIKWRFKESPWGIGWFVDSKEYQVFIGELEHEDLYSIQITNKKDNSKFLMVQVSCSENDKETWRVILNELVKEMENK